MEDLIHVAAFFGVVFFVSVLMSSIKAPSGLYPIKKFYAEAFLVAIGTGLFIGLMTLIISKSIILSFHVFLACCIGSIAGVILHLLVIGPYYALKSKSISRTKK
jgi:hypothetical protein